MNHFISMNRVHNLHVAAFVLAGLLLGCESTTSHETPAELTVEEAQAELDRLEFQRKPPPPRTLNDIRTALGDLSPVPKNCEAKRQKARENLTLLIEDLSLMDASAANSVAFDANTEFARGSIKRALQLQHWIEGQQAFRSQRYFGRWTSIHHANAMAGLVLLYGASGDARRSARYASMLRNIIKARLSATVKRGARPRAYLAIGRAAPALARGDLHIAEPALRDALHYGVAFKYGLTTINRAWLHGQLVSVLMQKGALVEAEIAAREGLRELISFGVHQSDVGAVAAHLSMVLAEQGRLDEAGFVARRSINLFESDCTLPESIPYVEARRILIQVLIAENDWEAAKTVILRAKENLASESGTFNRLFASTPEVGLVLVKGGEVEAGMNALSIAVRSARTRFGQNSIEHLEAQTMVAVAETFNGRDSLARDTFDGLLPDLLGKRNVERRRGDAARGLRQRLILETALALYARSEPRSPETVDIMFRISQSIRLTQVQRALSSTAARSAARDNALSELVRDEQDARDRLANTMESLSLLSLAPSDQVDLEVLNELKKRAESLNQVIKSLSNRIESEYPGYAQLLNPLPLKVETTRDLLREDESILRIHLTSSDVYVWAIGAGGGIGFHALPNSRRMIESQVQNLRDTVAPDDIISINDIPEFDLHAAKEIYRLLLEPVEQVWSNSKQVWVVADTPISTIPFSMLVRRETASRNENEAPVFAKYRLIDWLARTHAFTSLPSVSSLRSLELLEKRALATHPFIGFGAPTFNSQDSMVSASDQVKSQRAVEMAVRAGVTTRNADSAELSALPPLPETADELRSVARALGADEKIDVFLGKRATESQVRSMDLLPYRVIAFATHGLLPGDLNGLDRPALALTSSTDDDGLLTTDEIVGLKLAADWAVLSACNTGAADGLGAEAVSGLGRAFLYAGAGALLVSNWPVHSQSTVELIIRLFELQRTPNISRSEALRRAQIKLMSTGAFVAAGGKVLFSYAHPIFWAPFTIVGDGRRIASIETGI